MDSSFFLNGDMTDLVVMARATFHYQIECCSKVLIVSNVLFSLLQFSLHIIAEIFMALLGG